MWHTAGQMDVERRHMGSKACEACAYGCITVFGANVAEDFVLVLNRKPNQQ